MTRLKLENDIFKSSKKFFSYIYKCLKIYQQNIKKIKKSYKKKLIKDIKMFPKKKKKKSNNMAVNITKMSQKLKNKSLLSIEKNIIA